MTLMQSIVSLLILAACMGSHAGTPGADAGGSCAGAQQPSAGQAPGYSAPDYRVEADENAAPDPQDEAAQRAWTDYKTALVDALRQSPAPRDWALASVVDLDFRDSKDARGAQREALLKRAVDAAPDDVLVQWIALRLAHPGDVGNEARAEALQRLQRAEPDNAAVWMEQLMPARKRNDTGAVDRALSRMATASRFDGHFVDLTEALVEVYQRSPAPRLPLHQGDALLQSQKTFPYVMAVALTSAIALPAFQELITACRIDPATGANSQRSADCAAAGRLMVAHGDTQIANRIGMSLLRVSNSFGDDDVQKAREHDWLRKQFTTKLEASFEGQDQASVDAMIAWRSDWIATGSELEAMRLAVARAGEATTPPEDWVDKASPYSEERLKQDPVTLQRAANP